MGSTFGTTYLARKWPSGVAKASTAQPERPAPAVWGIRLTFLPNRATVNRFSDYGWLVSDCAPDNPIRERDTCAGSFSSIWF
jgi:hypothetical protein